VKEAKRASQAFGLEVRALQGTDQLEPTIQLVTKDRPGALLVASDSGFIAHRTRIAKLIARAKLPAIYAFKEHADAGGLISYGQNIPDIHRRAAAYVDKILKGAKPADLPRAAGVRVWQVMSRGRAPGAGPPPLEGARVGYPQRPRPRNRGCRSGSPTRRHRAIYSSPRWIRTTFESSSAMGQDSSRFPWRSMNEDGARERIKAAVATGRLEIQLQSHVTRSRRADMSASERDTFSSWTRRAAP